jgi:hypothetical protein
MQATGFGCSAGSGTSRNTRTAAFDACASCRMRHARRHAIERETRARTAGRARAHGIAERHPRGRASPRACSAGWASRECEDCTRYLSPFRVRCPRACSPCGVESSHCAAHSSRTPVAGTCGAQHTWSGTSPAPEPFRGGCLLLAMKWGRHAAQAHGTFLRERGLRSYAAVCPTTLPVSDRALRRPRRNFTSVERIHGIVNRVRFGASVWRGAAHRRPRILHKVSRKIHTRRQGVSKLHIPFATK